MGHDESQYDRKSHGRIERVGHFIARNSHTSRRTGRRIRLPFAPQGRSWASWEQRQEASCSYPYKVRFNLRVQPSKMDDYTSTRQTPQQEEAQEWRRSTFWSRLVARRKLLAALLLSVASGTQEKSMWTRVEAPSPHGITGKRMLPGFACPLTIIRL